MKYKIAFFKCDGPSAEYYDKLIGWWLNGKYSHCELIDLNGTGWSSSYIDGGIRNKKINWNSGNWDIIEIETQSCPDYWFRVRNGTPYDKLGVLGFLFRPERGNKDRFFCSEAIAAALGMEEAWRFDPNVLYCALTRK